MATTGYGKAANHESITRLGDSLAGIVRALEGAVGGTPKRSGLLLRVPAKVADPVLGG